jgi:aminoglycoside phosphotransferase (APT) family kinase protein
MSGWSVDISLLIPHPTEARVLLVPTENVWELPRVTIYSSYSNLHLLQRAIREQLNAEMTVLRWLSQRIDEEAKVVYRVWLMENHTPDWTPPANAQWFDHAALQTLVLVDETARQPMLSVLSEFNAPIPAERVPWMRHGWFTQAQAWVSETLNAHGYTLTSLPEQFKQFNLSALIRAETTAGTMYFKASVSMPLFCHEAKMMQTLGALLPQYIPAPIAIDEERHWMLSEDFGTDLRSNQPDLPTLQRMAKTYAALQIHTTSMLDTLLNSGCLDRRLEVLASQIDELMADEDCVAGLSEEERAEWKNSAPTLKALCQTLATYNVPYTLVHGDFHAGNVTLRGDDLLFFDWTDACVAHPFFDLPVMVNFDAKDNATALEDAYLACWTAYEPMERLREAYNIAYILGSLHQAVSYQSIRANTEAILRHEWDWGVPEFARVVLSRLRERVG